MEHNELHGSIPLSWGAMTSLKELSLHHNSIDNALPHFICDAMPSLTFLLLNNNHLEGSIPQELGNCTSLKQLYLDENFLRGRPPKELGNLHNLGMYGVILV